MEPADAHRSLLVVAALARIEEMGGPEMEATRETDEGTSGIRSDQGARAIWALGDYHRFARETVWDLGPVLVEACGITAGQRVLDVAAGTGNVAIRAAEKGADVVAGDLTLENFDAGRREAAAHGVELDWVEADAESLPFADGEFDVVTSAFGAIFAPDHRAVASELLRVCKTGGRIGMLNYTPEGLISEFFAALAGFGPPPPEGALPPPLWGDEEHVRELFGNGVEGLALTRGTYTEAASDPAAYVELFKRTFGPVVAIYEGLSGQHDRRADFDREFLEFATSANSGPPEGPAEYVYEYLLVVADRSSTRARE